MWKNVTVVSLVFAAVLFPVASRPASGQEVGDGMRPAGSLAGQLALFLFCLGWLVVRQKARHRF